MTFHSSLIRTVPLDGSAESLLECPGRGANRYEVAKGKPSRLIAAIASDCSGTFDGLGSVDAFLRGISRETDQRKLLKDSGTAENPFLGMPKVRRVPLRLLWLVTSEFQLMS